MAYEGPGPYKSWKGQYYYVLFLAVHSETGEEYVVYTPMYIPQGRIAPTIRPRVMFDEIKHAPPASEGGPWIDTNGSPIYSLPRFRKVGELEYVPPTHKRPLRP